MYRLLIAVCSLLMSVCCVAGCLLTMSAPGGGGDDVHGDDDNDDNDDDGDNNCNFSELASIGFEDAERMEVDDGFLYMISESHLAIADVSEPSDAELVSGVEYHFYNACDIAVHDGYIYVLDPSHSSYSDSEMYVFRASDPYDDPQQHRIVEISQQPEAIAIAKSRAWVATCEGIPSGNYPLLIYTLSSLTGTGGTPAPSSYTADGCFSALAADGDYLYGGFVDSDFVGTTSLKVLDISDPSDPVKVREITTPGEINRLYVKYDHLFATLYPPEGDGDSTRDLIIYSLADPVDPDRVGSYSDGSSFNSGRGVAVSGDYAYALVGGGLDVVDISVPSSPSLVCDYWGDDYSAVTLNRTTDDGALYVGGKWDVRVLTRCNP